MKLDPGIYAAMGALLIAVLNELRARSRARQADLERQQLRRDLAAQGAHTRRVVRDGQEANDRGTDDHA